MGWMMTTKPVINYDNSLDLRKNALIMHQHNHYQKWAITAGIVTPLLLGALTGHILGAFVMAIALRLAIVHHGTFFINSFAHTFGTSEYDADSTGKDNWFGALLTNGEGYHNYHHRFPSDYRNGIRWWHWDPTKWLIWVFSQMGLTYELKRTSPEAILQARQAALAKKASQNKA
jgi:stearoyl-CoA desaturase (delta-9 desaturase)